MHADFPLKDIACVLLAQTKDEDCNLQTKQSVKTKEEDDVFSRRPLYCGRAGSDVMGCRRPTSGVFVCMLQTRVTLMAFPIATPRGRSSKFP